VYDVKDFEGRDRSGSNSGGRDRSGSNSGGRDRSGSNSGGRDRSGSRSRADSFRGEDRDYDNSGGRQDRGGRASPLPGASPRSPKRQLSLRPFPSPERDGRDGRGSGGGGGGGDGGGGSGGGGDGGDGGRHHVAPVSTAHSAVLEIEIGEETALECYVYSDPTDSLPDEILLVLGDTGVRICELTTGEEVNAWVWAAISGWFQNKQRPETTTNTEDELALKRSAAGSTLDSTTGSNNNPGSNAEDGGEVELMDMFVMEVRGLGVFSFECEDSEVMARAFAAVRARAAGASRTGNVYGA
jgi:hypothetical protein